MCRAKKIEIRKIYFVLLNLNSNLNYWLFNEAKKKKKIKYEMFRDGTTRALANMKIQIYVNKRDAGVEYSTVNWKMIEYGIDWRTSVELDRSLACFLLLLDASVLFID